MVPQFQSVYCWILWLWGETYQLIYGNSLLSGSFSWWQQKRWNIHFKSVFESYKRNWPRFYYYQIQLNFMELQMSNLQEEFWKCIILNLQSYVMLDTQCCYFSMMFLKYPFYIKRFLPTRWYIIFSVVVYFTSLIPSKNINIKSFTMKKKVF